MKKLLVAVDLSARSDRALARSLAIAKELKAEIVVVYVIDEALPSLVAERTRADALAAIEDHLSSLPPLDREGVGVHVVSGVVYKTIIELAQEQAVDLIVMGVPRAESLGDLFLGTTVERVIRRGNHPVLVVRDRTKNHYENVLVGIDFSVYARRAVEFATQLVADRDITLVHAYELPFKSFLTGHSRDTTLSSRQQDQVDAMLQAELEAFLASLGPSSGHRRVVMIEGLVQQVLREEVTSRRADLLVVGTHGRAGVAHALLGSVALDLLGDPPCDVLAVKAW